MMEAEENRRSGDEKGCHLHDLMVARPGPVWAATAAARGGRSADATAADLPGAEHRRLRSAAPNRLAASPATEGATMTALLRARGWRRLVGDWGRASEQFAVRVKPWSQEDRSYLREARDAST